MIIKRYDKREKHYVYDVRLLNEYGKLQYFSCRLAKKTLAKEYQAKKQKEINEWKAFPERKIKKATFSEFVNGHYIPVHAKSLNSTEDYLSICRKLVAQFGEAEMEAVDQYSCESYLKRRYGQVSAYMANREFTVLKGIFTKAMEWGFRQKNTNPCKGVKMRKEEPRLRVLSNAEVDSLLAKCVKGCGHFYSKEFKGGLSVESLCAALMRDGYGPDNSTKSYSIEWLNALLTKKDLYDQVARGMCPQALSKRLKDIKRRYDSDQDKADLIRLNRVLLQERYPAETPKMPKKAVGLTQEEATELRDKIEIDLNCGPRKEELLNIRVQDCNLETGMLRLYGKGGKIRFVPMNKKALEIFQRRTRKKKRKEYIFGDGKVAPKDFKKAFYSLCERAGIEDARIHDLRRTFGTRCAIAGVPPKTLQKWMGHESIETTLKYYVQIAEDFEREAIERLSGFEKK